MTPNRREAWALARLLADMPLDGELAAMVAPWSAMARRLAEAPPDARLALWGDMLLALPDPDAADRAVQNAEPDGPPPDPSESSDDGVEGEWGAVLLGTLPRADPFPIDVLPGPARAVAEAAAEAIACPIDFPAAGTLAAASGAIGRSATLMVKPGYFASACLYLAVVGGPSSGKSPALRAALRPLNELAKELHEQWTADRDAWEAADKDGRGPRPTVRRIITTDPTTEALGPILRDNPRGLVVSPDEMTRWVLSMDQYRNGKGGDRPFYLTVWNGDAVYVDRAKNLTEPIAVPHPFLTVVGGMTPDMLSTLHEGRGRDDGFLARLIFAYPDPPPRRYSPAGISSSVEGEWERLVRCLWRRQPRDLDGRPTPHVVRFAPDAERAWTEWCHAHVAEQEADDFPGYLEGAWGKLDAYAARLALILHLMRIADDPMSPDEPPPVPRAVVDDAVRLVGYFKSHCRRIHARMGGRCETGDENTRAILRWIIRNGHTEFSTRDLNRDMDRFKDDPVALGKALSWVESRNAIRSRLAPDRAGLPGRKPAPIYDVNPTLHADPRFRHFRRKAPV
jgi:hypothetical protein